MNNCVSQSQLTLGILILNRNGKGWLLSIYASLRDNKVSNTRVYLVDNASDDGSVEMTLAKYPEVTIIRMPQNLGYSMAYNLAMPYAFTDGCDWIIWSNNDVLIEQGCLSELLLAAQSDSRIGILGPAFLAWDRDEPNYYMVENHPNSVAAMKARSSIPIDVEWVEGSFLMVSRRCVDAVGPLDPYIYFYWEETDFCRRARCQGWRVVLVPSAIARHYAGGSSVSDQKNLATANKLQTRNYYIYELANPFKGFFANLIAAIHLFLVNIRQHFPKKPSYMIFHIRAFTNVIKEIRPIYKKWVRDRKGDKPPITTRDFKSPHIEVIKKIL